MATSTSGSNISTFGRIQASDLNDIANHFRQWFAVSYSAPSAGTRINASDFNNLRQAILNGAGTAYSISQIPNTVSSGQRITSTTWGYATANFSSTTINYTSNGSYTIPAGCNSLTINQLVGGGGGGGYARSSTIGRSYTSSGGGSGGFVQSTTYPVSSGQTVAIIIGGGGQSGNGGGNTAVTINGNQIALAQGGDAGMSAYGENASGGSAVSGGNAGSVPNGGASPYNGYGAGGNGVTCDPPERIDTIPPRWIGALAHGASGASGYCSITYNP